MAEQSTESNPIHGVDQGNNSGVVEQSAEAVQVVSEQAESSQPIDNQEQVPETQADRDLRDLQAARAELVSLPPGHEDIPEKMLGVAGLMSDYHVSSRHQGEALLIESMEMAAAAEGLAGPDNFWRGSAIATQLDIATTLYRTTRNVEWLRTCTELGPQAIKFLDDRRDQIPPVTYSVIRAARCERLATSYQLLFMEERKREWIGEALDYQRQSIQYTNAANYHSNGEAKLPSRYKRWTDFWVLMVEQNDRPDYTHLLEHISSELLSSDVVIDKDSPLMGIYSAKVRLGILCRQWSHTKKPEDFELLHRYTTELMQVSGQYCCNSTCSLHKFNDESWGFDPTKPHHITRRAAEWYDYWYSVDQNWPKEVIDWSEDLPSINTSLVLWEEVTRNIPRETWGDILEDIKPCAAIRDRLDSKWDITKSAADAWLLDDRNNESSRINSLLKMASMLEWKPEDKISDILKNNTSVSTGISAATGEKRIMYPTSMSITQKPYTLDNIRLKFVLEEGSDKEKIENWISGRTDDGQYILGGAIRGRDDDILAHFENSVKSEVPVGQGKIDSAEFDASGVADTTMGWQGPPHS